MRRNRREQEKSSRLKIEREKLRNNNNSGSSQQNRDTVAGILYIIHIENLIPEMKLNNTCECCCDSITTQNIRKTE